MKIKYKEDKLFKEGDTQVITKYLIFPLKLGNELRWLEKAKIKQIVAVGTYGVSEMLSYLYWKNKEWVN